MKSHSDSTDNSGDDDVARVRRMTAGTGGRVASDYHNGFVAGMKEAASILRLAASDQLSQIANSKKVIEAQGMQFAAVVLASWANGLDMKADNWKEGDCDD